jgi:hypothetical protein
MMADAEPRGPAHLANLFLKYPWSDEYVVDLNGKEVLDELGTAAHCAEDMRSRGMLYGGDSRITHFDKDDHVIALIWMYLRRAKREGHAFAYAEARLKNAEERRVAEEKKLKRKKKVKKKK